MLRFCSLASGSSGNATLIEAWDGTTSTRVLVDCGLGIRQLEARLQRHGVSTPQLDAIFITHEHSDHVGCALTLSQRHQIKLFMSAGTWRALDAPLAGAPLTLVRDGELVGIGDIQLRPFTVPHDAQEPLQLNCTDGARSLGLLTDLGHVTPYVLSNLSGCNALLLECNHDLDLLERSSYPAFLKRRVGGSHGHLNNGQAAQALQALLHKDLHTVIAGHLSERNNRPSLVQAALSEILGCAPDEVPFCTPMGSGEWHSV
ncbi:MBL fold metallo-hydrolase [Ottowia thiooxydans]|uniref:MBL fold metallo-hydrolase n=1 Tax=Ottowia thiooxydans TaxID=219182 RepID=UPI0004035C97|nr:MBL fold metallo-hydrolase [Ottowia thiooxydans]